VLELTGVFVYYVDSELRTLRLASESATGSLYSSPTALLASPLLDLERIG
jgi:hypothetical protein